MTAARPDFPAITAQMLAVLTSLEKAWPIVASLGDVALGADYCDPRTARKYLGKLLDMDLVVYDAQLKRWLIADRGRALVEYVERKTCA